MPVPKPRPLVVFPNPFHALDGYGRPACAVRLDPSKHLSNGERSWIGATPQAELIEKRQGPMLVRGKTHMVGPHDRHDLTWAFALVPVEIPNTDYHRTHIQHGALIAGDAYTAKVSSTAHYPVSFVEPLDALVASQKAACETWEREHGAAAPAQEVDVAALMKSHASDVNKAVSAETAYSAKHEAIAKETADKAAAAAKAAADGPAAKPAKTAALAAAKETAS